MNRLLERLAASWAGRRASEWSARVWLLNGSAFAIICWLCWLGGIRLHHHSKLPLLPILPACGLALGIVAILLRGTSRVSRHFLAGMTLFVLLAGLDAQRCTYRPEGDEPWYLAMADSMATDGDLDVPPSELAARSPWYFGLPLPPEQLQQSGGQYRVTHWPALAVILIPACLLRDVFLARLTIALLAALAAGMGSALLSRLWRSDGLGLLSMALLVFATPFANYSLMLFPDGVAASVFVIALSLLTDRRSTARAVAGGVLAGALVWLKLPFLLIVGACGILGLFIRASDGRKLRGALWPTVACVAVLLPFIGFQASYYGAAGTTKGFESARAPSQLAQSLFEPGRGLLVHYPACAFLLATIVWVVSRRLWLMRTSVLHAASTVGASVFASGVIALPALILGVLAVGGWAPPGRYWIPTLTVFVFVIATERDAVVPVWTRLLRMPAVKVIVAASLVVGLATNAVLTLVPQVAFTDGPHWIQRLARIR